MRSRWRWSFGWVCAAFLVGACLSASSAQGDRKSGKHALRGKATWYGGKHHGGPTASGERFNKNALTAAHRTLPFDSRVTVKNLKNGRTVEVRINDRGPFGKRNRIIDLSEAAATRLNMLRDGVVPVEIEIVSIPKKPKKYRREF